MPVTVGDASVTDKTKPNKNPSLCGTYILVTSIYLPPFPDSGLSSHLGLGAVEDKCEANIATLCN